MRTPLRDSRRDSISPLRSKSEASTSSALVGGQQVQQTPASSSWLSPTKSGSEHDEKGKGSPVEGVMQPGALITFPPPREVARPELQKSSLPAGNLDEEEWVTVYGYGSFYLFYLHYLAYPCYVFCIYSVLNLSDFD
uniref:Uncharacterized protein n=1 Tax=Nelumbo nucifera TaxID=4432 RepID=A0A822XYW6_NELNU|nr:TPA_asm: hypothetical protein HUJ06_028292 [Nelumbo nucifera]